jgi:hypothetical protein
MTGSTRHVIDALLSIEPTAGVLEVDRDGLVVAEYGKAHAIFGGSMVSRNVDEISGLPEGTHRGFRHAFLSDPSSRPMRARAPVVIRRLDGVPAEIQIGLVPLPNGNTGAFFQRPKQANADLALGAPSGVPLPIMPNDSGRISVQSDHGTPTIRELLSELSVQLVGIRRDLHKLTTHGALAEQRSATIERDIAVMASRVSKSEGDIASTLARIAVLEDRTASDRRGALAIGGSAGVGGAAVVEIVQRLLGT